MGKAFIYGMYGLITIGLIVGFGAAIRVVWNWFTGR